MSELPMIQSLPGYPWLPEAEAARRDKARIAELEAENRRLLTDVEATARHCNGLSAERDMLKAALEPFALLKKFEQFRTSLVAENALITVVVRVGDIKTAIAALSGEGVNT